jgi:hypothetical protein
MLRYSQRNPGCSEWIDSEPGAGGGRRIHTLLRVPEAIPYESAGESCSTSGNGGVAQYLGLIEAIKEMLGTGMLDAGALARRFGIERDRLQESTLRETAKEALTALGQGGLSVVGVDVPVISLSQGFAGTIPLLCRRDEGLEVMVVSSGRSVSFERMSLRAALLPSVSTCSEADRTAKSLS